MFLLCILFLNTLMLWYEIWRVILLLLLAYSLIWWRRHSLMSKRNRNVFLINFGLVTFFDLILVMLLSSRFSNCLSSFIFSVLKASPSKCLNQVNKLQTININRHVSAKCHISKYTYLFAFCRIWIWWWSLADSCWKYCYYRHACTS